MAGKLPAVRSGLGSGANNPSAAVFHGGVLGQLPGGQASPWTKARLGHTGWDGLLRRYIGSLCTPSDFPGIVDLLLRSRAALMSSGK